MLDSLSGRLSEIMKKGPSGDSEDLTDASGIRRLLGDYRKSSRPDKSSSM